MKRFIPSSALCALAIIGALAACGSESKTPRSVRAEARSASPQSIAGRASRTAADVAVFSNVLGLTPGWQRIRRDSPTPFDELETKAEGLLVGTVAGVEPGPIEHVTLSIEGEAFPMTRANANLIVDIDQALGPSIAAVALPGRRVGVPIGVWFAARNAGAQADYPISKAIEELAASAPVGSKVAVFVKRVSESKDAADLLQAETSLLGELPDPATITFETADAGLVSLDWTVADDAESYVRASSVDEFLSLEQPKFQ